MTTVPNALGTLAAPTAQATSAFPEVSTAQQDADRAVEAAALQGSAAIRRIIAERNELRHECDRLRGANEELRYQNNNISVVKEHYRQLANDLLVQLKQINLAVQETAKRIQEAPIHNNHDPALVALARRLASSQSVG